MYLLDTNALSEPTKPTPNAGFVSKLQEIGWKQIAISSVTWHEVGFGLALMEASKRKRRLVDYFATIEPLIQILPYDKACAAWFADERARLTQIGQTPSYADGQIASVAASNGLILVTHNTRDFKAFSNLTLVNWMTR